LDQSIKNHVVHEYEEIDYFAVWDSVILGMPGLVEQINRIWIENAKNDIKK